MNEPVGSRWSIVVVFCRLKVEPSVSQVERTHFTIVVDIFDLYIRRKTFWGEMKNSPLSKKKYKKMLQPT